MGSTSEQKVTSTSRQAIATASTHRILKRLAFFINGKTENFWQGQVSHGELDLAVLYTDHITLGTAISNTACNFIINYFYNNLYSSKKKRPRESLLLPPLYVPSSWSPKLSAGFMAIR